MEENVLKRKELSRQSDTHRRAAYSGDRVLASILLSIFKVLKIVVRRRISGRSITRVSSIER